MSGRGSESFSLEQIKSDLLDESEPVRGHALIKLAKGIRRKNRKLLTDITASPEIVRAVLGQLFNYSVSLIFSVIYDAVITFGNRHIFLRSHNFSIINNSSHRTLYCYDLLHTYD